VFDALRRRAAEFDDLGYGHDVLLLLRPGHYSTGTRDGRQRPQPFTRPRRPGRTGLVRLPSAASAATAGTPPAHRARSAPATGTGGTSRTTCGSTARGRTG